MKFSERFISLVSNRRTAAFSVMGTALLGAYLSSIDTKLANAMVNLVSLQFTFSGEVFRSLTAGWSDATIQLYVKYLRIDMVFALCYALTLSSVLSAMWLHLVSLCGGNPPAKGVMVFRIAILLPALAAAANIGEDILLYSAARLGLTQYPFLQAQSSLAVAKYAFLIGSVAGIMTILFMRRRRMGLR